MIHTAKRYVWPMWRTYEVTRALGELLPLGKGPKHNVRGFYECRRSEWENNPTIGTAVDAIASALAESKSEDAKVIAKYIIDLSEKNKGLISDVNIWSAREILDLNQDDTKKYLNKAASRKDIFKEIADLKKYRIFDPRNSITLIELARCYANIGQNNKAAELIQQALILSPSNRYIIRSAARFFIHVGDKERAYWIMATASAQHNNSLDPWIESLKAEIERMMGRRPKKFKRLSELAANENISPHHLAELRAAIASLHNEDNEDRKTRRMIRAAMQSANSNALAQAVSIYSDNGWSTDLIKIADIQTDYSFEADAMLCRDAADWDKAKYFGSQWLEDQPMSSRSILFNSGLLGTYFEDYEESIKIEKRGLQSNPDDAIILNNLAYSQINLNKYSEAAITLNKAIRLVKAKDHIEGVDTVYAANICLMATSGLLAWRQGDVVLGKKLYLEAEKLAKMQNMENYASQATLFRLLEEVKPGSALSVDDAKVLEAANSSESMISRILAARVNDALAGKRIKGIPREIPLSRSQEEYSRIAKSKLNWFQPPIEGGGTQKIEDSSLIVSDTGSAPDS